MKKQLFFIMLLFSISLCFAGTPSLIEFSYDFSKTYEEDTSMHYTSSVVLTIHTPSETNCFYTTVETAIPSNPFEKNFGTKHEKTIDGLEDGLQKYYIQCGNSSSNPIMETSFRTKAPVAAQIEISEESPLKAGTYEITLQTSSLVIGLPILEYSLNALVYHPIALEGSGKIWQGHLILDKSIKEAIGSFKFKATDLDGKEGTTIIGKSIFIVDTKPPEVIQTLEATSYQNQVELSWHYDEEVEEYNIYKSEHQEIDYTNDFITTDETTYIDNNVQSGKTYYYRIAAVDKANNIGPLSRVIQSTALISNKTVDTGLTPKLIGKVDNLLTEIRLLKEDIQVIEQSINSKEEKEKNLFKDIELTNDYSRSISEINSIEKDVDRLKLQDLSEIELNNKLNSNKLRIEIVKQDVPETITITEEKTIKRDFANNKLEEIFLEYSLSTLEEINIDKTVKRTLNLIKENEISIESTAYNIEITYLDGSNSKLSVIKDTIKSTLERSGDTNILLLVPKDIAEKASNMNFLNRNYEVIKEDPLISFDADTKEITYTLNKQIDIEKIEDIIITPIILNSNNPNTLITGNSILNYDILNYKTIAGPIILILVLIGLAIYLFYIRKNKKSENIIQMEKLILEAKKLKEDKKTKELKEHYSKIKQLYTKLIKEEKEKIYPKIKQLHKK